MTDLELWLGDTIEVQAQLPTVPEAITLFTTYAVGALMIVLLIVGLVRLAQPGTLRRGFRCPLAMREVEVEFGTRGFRRLASVRSCSAFEDARTVACGRRCLDARFRKQWEYALPVSMRPGGQAAA
jgi:hypothetical protein